MWKDQLAAIDNVQARLNELERLAPLDGADILLSSFADPYGPIRLRAAELLSRQMTPELSDVVVDAITHDGPHELTANETTRSAVCLALASENVGTKALHFLGASLADESDEVRYHAVMGLHSAGGELDFSAELSQILEDSADPGLIVVAAQVAAFRGWVHLAEAIIGTRERVRKEDRFQVDLCLGELSEAGAAIGPRLKDEILGDVRRALKSEATMAAALNGLVAWNDTESIPLISKAAAKWRVHPLLKVDAARALYQLGSPDGLESLGKSLRSRRKDVRGYTIDLVGQIPISELFESVAAIANSPDDLADQAVEALAKFGGRGAEVLQTVAQTHGDPAVRELARTLAAR